MNRIIIFLLLFFVVISDCKDNRSVTDKMLSGSRSTSEKKEMALMDILKNNTFILAIHQPSERNNVELIGTVFSVSPHYFISVLHNLKKWDEKLQLMALNTNTGENILLTVVDKQSERDLVVFKGNNSRKVFINIEKDSTQKGDKIFIYGYPKEKLQSVNDYKGTFLEASLKKIGILSEIKSLGSIIIFDAILLGNHSGSPIVNEKGNLVGVSKAEIVDVKEYENHSLGIYLAPNDSFIAKYIY